MTNEKLDPQLGPQDGTNLTPEQHRAGQDLHEQLHKQSPWLDEADSSEPTGTIPPTELTPEQLRAQQDTRERLTNGHSPWHDDEAA